MANEPTYLTHKFVEKNVNANETLYSENLGVRTISLPIHFYMKVLNNNIKPS